MSTRQDYITALGSLVKNESDLGEAAQIVAIAIAIAEHSKHRPRIIPEDLAGSDRRDYPVTLLAAWSDGFSVIKQVEYPIDPADEDQVSPVLQDDDWMLYKKPAGDVLRFLNDKPAATEYSRVTYTAPHACDDTVCTIKAVDENAVQLLAASHFCHMVATYYAQTQDSTVGADSVDHKSKSSDYAARARVYRKLYFDHLGIREGETPAASVTRDGDLLASWGSDRLTHPQRYR